MEPSTDEKSILCASFNVIKSSPSSSDVLGNPLAVADKWPILLLWLLEAWLSNVEGCKLEAADLTGSSVM